MAQPRYRHFVLFLGRKFGECNALSYDAQSGDEVMFDANGIAGLSDGITQIRISADHVIPVSGTKIDLWDLFLNKKEFVAKTFAGGKTISFPARITSMSGNSDSKTGAAHGKIEITQSGEASIS